MRIDCKSAKEILQKDILNIASKQVFAGWQAILLVFDFAIKSLNGFTNSLPDFLTTEFLQEIPCYQNPPKNTKPKPLPNPPYHKKLPLNDKLLQIKLGLI